MSGGAGFLPSTVVYHNFRQLWLVFRGFKLMEINSNVFSRLQVVLMYIIYIYTSFSESAANKFTKV